MGSFFPFPMPFFSLPSQDLPLSTLCLYFCSLIFFSKLLPTLVSKVTPLSPYFSNFALFHALLNPQDPSALSTFNQSSLQTSLLPSYLLSIICFSIFYLLSLPHWAELYPLVRGLSLDLLKLDGGDVLKLSHYREMLPSTRQSWVHFDPSQ